MVRMTCGGRFEVGSWSMVGPMSERKGKSMGLGGGGGEEHQNLEQGPKAPFLFGLCLFGFLYNNK